MVYECINVVSPSTNQLMNQGIGVCVWGGGGGKLFLCPYPPKVQACPPWDQTPTPPSRISGQGEMVIRINSWKTSDKI